MKCRYHKQPEYCEIEQRFVKGRYCKKKCEWYRIEREIERLEAENEMIKQKLYEQHLKNCVDAMFVGLD